MRKHDDKFGDHESFRPPRWAHVENTSKSFKSVLCRLNYSSVPTCVSVLGKGLCGGALLLYFIKSSGHAGDVVSSTHRERITAPSAKRRLTKTGRLNNTFITCRGPSSCQIHNKQSILDPAHFPTRTSHSAGNLRRGCIDLSGASFLTNGQTEPPYHRQRRKTRPHPLQPHKRK